jgi:hypothetical protein
MDSPYIGRIVTLLSPVFAGVAGWVATLAAEYLPGAPDLDEAELTAIFVAGALAAAGVLFKWIDNRGDHEVQEAAIAFQQTQAEPGESPLK